MSAGVKSIESRLSGSGQPSPATAATAVATVQRYMDALNNRTFTDASYAALFCNNVVIHGARLDIAKDVAGVTELHAFDSALFTKTFPDGKLVLACPISCDNAGFVHVAYTFEGTMRAAFPSGAGVATNKRGCMAGAAKYHVGADGKIETGWVVNDHYALLCSLGLIQPLSGTTAACCSGASSSSAGGIKAPMPVQQQHAEGGGVIGSGQPSMMDQQARAL